MKSESLATEIFQNLIKLLKNEKILFNIDQMVMRLSSAYYHVSISPYRWHYTVYQYKWQAHKSSQV